MLFGQLGREPSPKIQTEFRASSYHSFWRDFGGILGCFFGCFSSVFLCGCCFNSFWFALQKLVFFALFEVLKPPQYTNRLNMQIKKIHTRAEPTDKQACKKYIAFGIGTCFGCCVRNAMHTRYIKRTTNKQARNQRSVHASKARTHKSKTNRQTNKQETYCFDFLSEMQI